MNKLEVIIPKIKRNLKKFQKPNVLFVRPGFCIKNGWPTTKKAIVAVTSRTGRTPKLPSQVEGIPVEVRPATELEQYSHDKPEQYSQLADRRAEFRGTSLLPEFSPTTGGFKSPISAKVTAARHKKIPLNYEDSAPKIPLDPVTGTIRITCHASPDSGWPTLRDFVSATKAQLKVSMYDFTSKHILDLFDTSLRNKKVQLTLDDPSAPNPTADQLDPATVASLEKSISRFGFAWALVESSAEADTWLFPSAYHIKVMSRDSEAVWVSSGNLNNSNQPEIDPFDDPQPTDQATAKASDRDWHVIVESPALAKTFEAYLDSDFQVATLHAARLSPPPKRVKPPGSRSSVVGSFQFAKPLQLNEPMTITPLLTPDTGVYQGAMLDLINSVEHALYIQLQYIHPTSDGSKMKFTDLIDAVAAKINAGLDVRIILSEFQRLKGGLEALQAAGVSLDHVKIQNNVHNKGFVFDHKKVVVSSMNWSGEGVLSNRDAGVIIDNAKAAIYFEEIFLNDWNNHAEQSA